MLRRSSSSRSQSVSARWPGPEEDLDQMWTELRAVERALSELLTGTTGIRLE